MTGRDLARRLTQDLLRAVAVSTHGDRIFLAEERGAALVVIAGMNLRSTSEGLDSTPTARAQLAESVAAHVLRTGAPVHLTEPARDPRFRRDPYLLERNPRTVMCLPMSFDAQPAALYVERVASVDAFTREELEVARLLAQQATAAIESARHYECELRARERHLDPQFLHNLLSVIAELVVSDAARAEATLLTLSRLHRYAFDAPMERLVSLSDEVRVCRDYLTLEQCRLGERFHVLVEVSGDADRVQVPALVLQRLIENSVRHGSARKMGDTSLRVSVVVDGGVTRLAVWDDGPESDPGAGRPGREVGVRDAMQRLSRYFPRRCSVRFDRTTVEVTLPARGPHAADERSRAC